MKDYILPTIYNISSLGLLGALYYNFPTFIKLIFFITHFGISLFYIKNYLFFYTNRYLQIVLSTIIYTSFIIVFGTAFFYIASLSKFIIGSIFVVISIILTILHFTQKKRHHYSSKFLADFKSQFLSHYKFSDILIGALLVCYTIISISAFNLLLDISITDAIRSPWKLIPKSFIALYLLGTITLLISSWYTRWKSLQVIFISLHYFLTVGIALLIYPIGYGFDPFIHRATEEIIALTGTLHPKPLYYIGQYSLVVILHHITQISLHTIDYFLIPVFFSLAIPATIFNGILHAFKKSPRISLLTTFIPLLLPLHLFITTTPQSFANTFTLITIFIQLYLLYLYKIKKIPLTLYILPLLLITGASIAIHPLAGIPNLIFFGFIVLFLFRPIKKVYSILQIFSIIAYSIFSAILLPAVFIVNHLRARNSFDTAFKTAYEIKNSLTPILDPYFLYYQNRFNLIGDISYFFIYNWLHVLIILLVLAIVFLYRKGRLRVLLPYILTFIVLVCNYYILKTFISFDMLIDYERLDYPARILMIGFYFVLPIAAYIFSLCFNLIKNHYTPFFAHVLVFVLAIFITSMMYSAYPREDGYIYNTGYNVSQADIAAVHYIERDAFEKQLDNYIVLANQTVSVAALKEFGFKTYYPTKEHGELFYYPIPTSSPLYEFYIDMVYKMPSQHIINDAADFINVDDVYFVVNKYWARSREIINLAKKQADYWTALDNDSIYIFKYSKKEIKTLQNYLPTGIVPVK